MVFGASVPDEYRKTTLVGIAYGKSADADFLQAEPRYPRLVLVILAQTRI
jgi:hypothetical protein